MFEVEHAVAAITAPRRTLGRFLISDQKALLVEDSGIEPLTYWLQTSRSPS